MRVLYGALLLAASVASAASPALARGAEEPLPRFEDPICPGVAGLDTEAAELMVGRIRQNAEALGRKMAEAEGCRPNLIVDFVANGHAFVQLMDRDESYAFDEMEPADRKALLEERGPVHVVSRVATHTRDGTPVYSERNLVNVPQASMWMAHSKIYTGTQRNIVHALVLIDRAATRGLTLDQLADYVTMRALVYNPPAAGTTGADSILNLFAAPAARRPATLTGYDRALLGALYDGIPNLPGNVKIAAIERATGLPYPRK